MLKDYVVHLQSIRVVALNDDDAYEKAEEALTGTDVEIESMECEGKHEKEWEKDED